MHLNLLKRTLLNIPFFFIAFLTSTTLNSFGQIKITLRDAIDSTLKNNLQLKESIVNEASSELDVYKAKISQYPNLNAFISGNMDFGRSLDPTTNLYLTQNGISSTENIQSTFVIFQGRQKINQIQENKLLLESNKNATQKLKNDLIIQVVGTYLAAMSYRDQLIAAKQQNELAKQLFDSENKRFDIGKKSFADVSKAKSEVAKTDVNITTIQNQFNNTMVDLKQLMNAGPKITLQLTEPNEQEIDLKERTIYDIYLSAVEILPEIKIADLNKKAAEEVFKVAKGAYYPVVSLSGTVASSYLYQFHFAPSLFGPYQQLSFFPQLHTNLYEYVGINLSIPIFNNFNTKISVHKAKLDLENKALDEQIAKSNLYKVISQAVSDMDAAAKNYSSAQESLKTAQDVFDVMQKRYQAGSSNSFDFNQAQNDRNLAEFTLIFCKYNLIFRKKVIDFYVGNPITY